MTRKNFSSNNFHLIFAILVFSLLVSCASPPQTATIAPAAINTKPPDPTSTPTPETTPAEQSPTALPVDSEDLSGVAIRFVHPWAGEAGKVLEDIATQFSLSNPWGIWVDVEAFGSERLLLDSLESDIETGDAPSLIVLHPYHLAVLEGEYFSINLSDYFEDPEWGFDAEAQADISPILIDQFIVDGNLIALPIAPQATVLFYNHSWAQDLSYSASPENEAEFRELACAATFANLADENRENDGTGGWLVNLAPNVLASWHQAFDGSLSNDTTPKFDNEPARSAFSYIKSTYDEGCFWVGRQAEPYYYFANRYTLVYAGTLDQIPAQMGWMDVAGNQDEWQVMGFPGPAGESVMIDGPGLMITADELPNQMAAWLFARHLLEPAQQAEIARSLLTIPVRRSAMALLEDFSETYPQWAQGLDLMDTADPLPISQEWGVVQWFLQDAINRLIISEKNDTDIILEELDLMIEDYESFDP